MAKSPGKYALRDKSPLSIVAFEGVQSLDDLIRSRSVAKKGEACIEARFAAAIAPTQTMVVFTYHTYGCGTGASGINLFRSPDCATWMTPH